MFSLGRSYWAAVIGPSDRTEQFNIVKLYLEFILQDYIVNS